MAWSKSKVLIKYDDLEREGFLDVVALDAPLVDKYARGPIWTPCTYELTLWPAYKILNYFFFKFACDKNPKRHKKFGVRPIIIRTLKMIIHFFRN